MAVWLKRTAACIDALFFPPSRPERSQSKVQPCYARVAVDGILRLHANAGSQDPTLYCCCDMPTVQYFSCRRNCQETIGSFLIRETLVHKEFVGAIIRLHEDWTVESRNFGLPPSLRPGSTITGGPVTNGVMTAGGSTLKIKNMPTTNLGTTWTTRTSDADHDPPIDSLPGNHLNRSCCFCPLWPSWTRTCCSHGLLSGREGGIETRQCRQRSS